MDLDALAETDPGELRLGDGVIDINRIQALYTDDRIARIDVLTLVDEPQSQEAVERRANGFLGQLCALFGDGCLGGVVARLGFVVLRLRDGVAG